MNTISSTASRPAWPELRFESLRDTVSTLHLWTQIVGKVRMSLAPRSNHSWHTTLYVSSRGLTTSAIPFADGILQIDLDFHEQRLKISTSDGSAREMALEAGPIADFHSRLLTALGEVGVDVRFSPLPQELPDPVAFHLDTVPRVYDPEQARAFWSALVQADRVMQSFRSEFVGKSSPVHFFWGSFDLAVTRFSGRRAPEHPGGVPNLADWVVRDAYSHEVISAGFWPGSGLVLEPSFYAYAYPEPAELPMARISPAAAYYHTGMHEFILPYEAVRRSADPDAALLEFLRSTYDSAARLAGWDLDALRYSPATGARREGIVRIDGETGRGA